MFNSSEFGVWNYKIQNRVTQTIFHKPDITHYKQLHYWRYNKSWPPSNKDFFGYMTKFVFAPRRLVSTALELQTLDNINTPTATFVWPEEITLY